MPLSLFKKSPAKNSAFSEFMRNASASEQKRVFKKVIEESIAEQRRTIEQAERKRQRMVVNGD